jgi:hypothetical protein
MALVPATLQAQLVAAFDKAQKDKTATSQSTLCQDLATAIDAYIKTATVTVPLGVAVQVAVPAGTGATTAPGIGTIS